MMSLKIHGTACVSKRVSNSQTLEMAQLPNACFGTQLSLSLADANNPSSSTEPAVGKACHFNAGVGQVPLLYLLRALSISMTTSTERAMVIGSGAWKMSQSTPEKFSGSAKHCIW